ncbi:MAG: hypothetical protein ACM3KR_06120 [Deltaproteobacteria bacterium]
MIISVNSLRKSSGTSTFSISLGIQLSQATDFSVLLIDGSYLYSDIDAILGIETDRGLDDILDLLNSNKINEKLFKDIAIEFGNFYVLTGSKISQYNRFEMDDINYNRIFNIAESLFDIIIIDSPTKKMSSYLNEKGRTNERFIELQIAKQNFLIFEKYTKSKDYNKDGTVLVINNYWDGRKFSKNYIINEYKIKVPVFTMRHSDKLLEAYNDRLIDRYLLNENDGYIEDLKVFMNYLGEIWNFPLKNEYVVKKNVIEQASSNKKKGLFW